MKKCGVGSLLLAAVLCAGCTMQVDPQPDPGLGSALGHPSNPPGTEGTGSPSAQNPNASGSGKDKVIEPPGDLANTSVSSGTTPDPVPWDHGPAGHHALPGKTPGQQ